MNPSTNATGNNSSFHMAQCANCLILELKQLNFRTCSQCKLVQYCSRDCQRQHWKVKHRHVCQNMSQATQNINMSSNGNSNQTAVKQVTVAGEAGN